MRKANKNFKPEKPRVSNHKKRSNKLNSSHLGLVCLFAGLIGLVTLIWTSAQEPTDVEEEIHTCNYQTGKIELHRNEEVDEEPVDEEPADEEPVDEEPVDEEPGGEDPAGEDPEGEDPAGEDPVDEENSRPIGADCCDIALRGFNAEINDLREELRATTNAAERREIQAAIAEAQQELAASVCSSRPPPPPPPPASQAFPEFSVDLTCHRIGIRGLHDPDKPGEAVGYQVRVDDGDGNVISYYDADGEDYGQGDFDLLLPPEDAKPNYRNNGWRVTVIAFDSNPALNATRTAGPTGPCLSARCEALSVQSTRAGYPNGTHWIGSSGQYAIVEPGKPFKVTASVRSGPVTVPPRVGIYDVVKVFRNPDSLGSSRAEPLSISLPPPTTSVEFEFRAPTSPGYYTGGAGISYTGGGPASHFTDCDFRIEVRPNKPPAFFPSTGFKPEATAPVTLNLEVNARDQDGDGSIARVEFYRSGTSVGKLGEDTTAPYQHKWKITTPGAYTLTAYAYDHDGARSSQTLGTIDVLPPGRSSSGAVLVWPAGTKRAKITEAFVRENNSFYTSLNYPSKPGTWTAWAQKMDQVVSKPVVAYLGADQLLLFGKRQDGFIYYRSRTGSGPTAIWGPITPLDKSLTNIAGDPVVVTEPDGKKVHVFIRTTNKRLYTKSYDGKSWTALQHLSSPQQLGITVPNPTNAARSDPVVISRAPGQLEVVANTIEGQVPAQWRNIYSNNSWSGWYFAGGGGYGGPLTNPVLASAGPDHIGAVRFSPSSKRLTYRNLVGSWGWNIPKADVGGTEILDDDIQYYNTVPTARFFKSTQHNTTYLNVLVKGQDGSLRLGTWGPSLPYENGLQTLNANPLGNLGVGAGAGIIGLLNPTKVMGTPTLIGEGVQSHANVNTVQALVLKPGGWYVLSTSTSIDAIVNNGKANWSSPKLNQLGFPPAP